MIYVHDAPRFLIFISTNVKGLEYVHVFFIVSIIMDPLW